MPEFVLKVADQDDPNKWHSVSKGFESFSWQQDIHQPAATFTCELPPTKAHLALFGRSGQRCEVYIDDRLTLTGEIDERSERANKDGSDLRITGRDVGKHLVDNAVPMNRLSTSQMTLLRVCERICGPWINPDEIRGIVADTAAHRYIVSGPKGGHRGGYWKSAGATEGVRDAIWVDGGHRYARHKKWAKKSPYYRGVDQDKLRQSKIDPGERAWDVVSRLAAQVGCHPLMTADGYLALIRPAYNTDPTLYGRGIEHRWDWASNRSNRSKGGNVLGSHLVTSISERFSDWTVYAESKPNKSAKGKATIGHGSTLRDPGPAFWQHKPGNNFASRRLYKQEIIPVHSLNQPKLIRRLARGKVEDSCVKGVSLSYTMRGFASDSGHPYCPDTMINVRDERYDIFGAWYIQSVNRRYALGQGKVTILKLMPAEIWLHHDHDATSDTAWEQHLIDRVWW